MTMVSYITIEDAYRAIRNHVSDETMEKIVDDLLQVKGSKAFRDIIKRLASIDSRRL